MRDNALVRPAAPPPTGRRLRESAALAAAALALLAACSGSGPADATKTALPRCESTGIISIGEKIPTRCRFERLQGGVLRLADLVGKPAVINFWASWCTYCIDEMPAFQRVFASLDAKVAFVGANLLRVQGETRGEAARFARSTGVRYSLIYDDGGLLFANFSAQLLVPATIFVRADGVVAFRVFGPQTEKQLRSLVRAYLKV
jgi:thiol-disulfide isomerase/thioredoxin